MVAWKEIAGKENVSSPLATAAMEGKVGKCLFILPALLVVGGHLGASSGYRKVVEAWPRGSLSSPSLESP